MRNIIKSIVFVIILFILFEVAAAFFLPFDVVKKYGVFKAAEYDILSEEADVVDAITIGDSLTYNAINPMEIWHNYGYAVYNCGTQSQLASTSYEYLKVAIEHEHPKVVFFEANVLFRDPMKQPWYIRYKNKLKYYLPLFKVHNGWKSITFDSADTIPSAKGFRLAKRVGKAKVDPNYMKDKGKIRKIPEVNAEYFRKMAEVAKENDVRLIVVATPSPFVYNYAKRASVLEITDELGLEFIDFNVNNEVQINWNKDSKDKGDHLNYRGAQKMSKWTGEFLQKTNLFEDKRGNKKYATWDAAYEKYLKDIS